MRGMTLLARRRAIRLEDRVYKRAQRSDYRPAPFHLLALRWFRARQLLAHHSPMHPELVRHCPDRPNTELVFPTDLLEQLHLGSPLHPQPPASSTGCWTWRGGANLRYRKGRFTVSKSTLTVMGLHLSEALERVLSSTNLIENLFSRFREVAWKVKRWQVGTMVLRWTATGVLEAERYFRKVAAYRALPRLAAVLHARDVALDRARRVDNRKQAA